MSPLSFHVLTGIDWEKTNLPSFFQIHILIYTYDNMSAGAGGSIRPSRRGDGTQLLGIIGDEVRNNVYDTRRTAQARERERERVSVRPNLSVREEKRVHTSSPPRYT